MDAEEAGTSYQFPLEAFKANDAAQADEYFTLEAAGNTERTVMSLLPKLNILGLFHKGDERDTFIDLPKLREGCNDPLVHSCDNFDFICIPNAEIRKYPLSKEQQFNRGGYKIRRECVCKSGYFFDSGTKQCTACSNC
jgi:hypothetical protein